MGRNRPTAFRKKVTISFLRIAPLVIDYNKIIAQVIEEHHRLVGDFLHYHSELLIKVAKATARAFSTPLLTSIDDDLHNVVHLPVLKGGKGYSLIGHHKIFPPLLAWAIVERLPAKRK